MTKEQMGHRSHLVRLGLGGVVSVVEQARQVKVSAL